MMYEEIFGSIRQVIASWNYYQEFTKMKNGYGKKSEFAYLDEFLMFLYREAHYPLEDDEFLKFCAKKENMGITEYINMLIKP